MSKLLIILAYFSTIAGGFTPEQIAKELYPLEIALQAKGESIESVFGEIHFGFIETDDPGYSCWSTLKCYGSINPLDDPKSHGLFIHELGHRFLNAQNLTFVELDLNLGYYEDGQYVHVTGINPQTGQYLRTARGYPAEERPYFQHPPSVPITGQTYQEDFADMFMAWALNNFTDDKAGRLRYEWMDNFVKSIFKQSKRWQNQSLKKHYYFR